MLIYIEYFFSPYSDSSFTSPTSPLPPPPMSNGGGSEQLSPTKTLIQKFNTLGTAINPAAATATARPVAHRNVIHVQSNPMSSCSNLSSPITPSSPEPMYATIGSKNRSKMINRLNKGAGANQI